MLTNGIIKGDLLAKCFRNEVTDRNVTCCCSRLGTPLPSSDVFPGRQKKTILTFSEPVYQFSLLQVTRDLGTKRREWKYSFLFFPLTHNSTHAFGGCLRGNSHIGTATGDMTHRFERVFIAIDNLLLLNGHHPALIACHVWTTGPLQTVY